MALSDKERQRKRREKLKQSEMKSILVKGKDGRFDPRIRTALAIQKLSLNDEIKEEIIKKIIETSETIFGDEDIVTQKYIRKIMGEYLRKRNE